MTRQHGLVRRWPVLAALLLTTQLAGHPVPAAPPLAMPMAAALTAGPALLAIGKAEAAREHLRGIHAGLEMATGEAPAQVRYVHTMQQMWSAYDTPEAKGGVAYQVQRWRAADRSASERRVALPPHESVAPTIRDFGAGDYPLDFERPSPLPEILAGQLVPPGKRHPGPEHYLRAISTMHKNHCLNHAQRAAVVRVLADTDGLEFHQGVVDRAGRAGVAVSFTSPPSPAGDRLQDLLIFNPETGELLSHEQVLHVNAASSEVRQAIVYSYVLFLACENTDQRPSP